MCGVVHTVNVDINCKDTIPKIHIPRKEIVRPHSQFPHSCVCERFIYSQDRSSYFPVAEKADRSWEYINRSQTHENGNWD
jgi:hypothetical protein